MHIRKVFEKHDRGTAAVHFAISPFLCFPISVLFLPRYLVSDLWSNRGERRESRIENRDTPEDELYTTVSYIKYTRTISMIA